MCCGDSCPSVRSRRYEDWSIPDPKDLSDAEFRAVRDLLEGKMKQLLAELQADPGKP